jgi:uncharacterized protein YhjY with autotransporter beta-barrel domain
MGEIQVSKPQRKSSLPITRAVVPALLAIGLMVSAPDWMNIAQAEGYYNSPESAVTQNANVVTAAMGTSSSLGMAIGKRTGGGGSNSTSGFRIDGITIGGVQLDGTYFADEDSAAGASSAGQLGGFVTAVGGFGELLGQLDFKNGGLIGGVDYQFTDALLGGLSINWISSSVAYANGGGGSEKDTYGASLYTGYSDGPLSLDALFNYSFSDYEMTRVVFAEEAKGNNNSDEIFLAAGASYDFYLGDGLKLAPAARLSLVKVWMDGYSESGLTVPVGGPNPNTNYSAFTVTSLTTDLGAEASIPFKTSGGVITPKIYGFWVHEFENNSQVLTYRAVGAAGGVPFETAILPNPDRNYFRLGVGATMELQQGLEIYVDYESIVGFRLLESHQFSAGGRIEF